MNVILHPRPELTEPVQPLPDLCTADLFGDRQTLTIEHHGMLYTLRITRQGKLLLTK